MNALACSVVICAFTEHRWDDLVAAAQSVGMQSVEPLEVLVVIDHNEVLFRRACRDLVGVRVMESEHPRGLSGARNTGIAHAKGDILAFLDDDAVADPSWLQELLAPFADPDVVGTGGWSNPSWPDDVRPRWMPDEFLWVVGSSYRGMPTVTAEVRNPIGCSMAFRRTALESVHGFSTGIGRVGSRPVGCEETELSIKVRQARPAARIVLEPKSVVNHRVSPARTRYDYFVRRCFFEGVSKALISRTVGSADALSNERDYVTRTLPAGIFRELALRGSEPGLWGWARAATIGVGVACTAAGYARGALASRR